MLDYCRHPPRHAGPLGRHRQSAVCLLQRGPKDCIHFGYRRDIMGKAALHRWVGDVCGGVRSGLYCGAMATTQGPVDAEL